MSLFEIPEPCGCVLSRTEGHRCLPDFCWDGDLSPQDGPQGDFGGLASPVTPEHDHLWSTGLGEGGSR